QEELALLFGGHRSGRESAPGVVSESRRGSGREACGQVVASDNGFSRRDRMKWQPVESSAFWAAAYAEGQALLYLLFRSGEVYRYCEFPRWRYQEFLEAESKGRYFGSNIRGRFRYERMRRPR